MRAVQILVSLALILCLSVVVFGAYVRLSHAGLGCPDWPGCYGQLVVPGTAEAQAQAQAAYPDRRLETPKAWKEMLHRYLASALGLLIVVLALLGRSAAGRMLPRRLPWVLVALVIFQGILGMWTVTWQLKPIAVTAHLLGGMATLGMLFWLWLDLRAASRSGAGAMRREPRNEREAWQAQVEAPKKSPLWSLRWAALLAAVLLIAQIFLGGWTSSNYAALACPDLPTCHGSWWPDLDIPEAFTLWRGLGVNYEFGVLDNQARVTIHHLHRMGALIVTGYLLLLGWLLARRGSRPLAHMLWAALALQVTIGLSVVLWQLPLPLAAAHNAGAALLWLTVLAINHRIWKPSA